MAELRRDAKLAKKMSDAIDTVLAGSDLIRGHTDQGCHEIPAATTKSRTAISPSAARCMATGVAARAAMAALRHGVKPLRLAAASAPTPADGPPPSVPTVVGESTENLQAALNKLGDSLKVDGINGY